MKSQAGGAGLQLDGSVLPWGFGPPLASTQVLGEKWGRPHLCGETEAQRAAAP